MVRPKPKLMFLAFAVAIIVVVAGFVGGTGTARGTEFSPDTFAHRSFRYYVFAGFRVTPKQVSGMRTPLEDYLHETGLIPPSDHDPPRWYLLKGMKPNVRGWSGVAKKLCNTLDCSRNNSGRWVTWSENNPDAARILWPKVVALARHDEIYSSYAILDDILSGVELDQSISAGEMEQLIERVHDVFDPHRELDLK